MILPSKNRKTASVAIILKRLRGSDFDGMKGENSEYVSNEQSEHSRMAGEDEMRHQMNEDETESLRPIAFKVMKALEQKDEAAFASYMMDLIRKCK